MVVSVRVERAAIWLGEYPSSVLPELAGRLAFGVLRFAVDSQQID